MADTRLTEAQALAQIAEDLGLDELLDPPALLLAAAEDLGIVLRGSSAAGKSGGALLRGSIRLVCDELGIAHGWEWQPQPEQDEQPRSELGSVPGTPAPQPTSPHSASSLDEADLTDGEKVAAIFAKFDADGDGLMAWTEASAFSLAKEGEALEPEAWAQICSALSVVSSACAVCVCVRSMDLL